MNLKELLQKYIADFKIQLNKNQLSQFERYFELLVEWNGKMNLTAITDADGVALKHFADCLALFNFVDIPKGASVIDVGTGAGFPGLVLKIARPDIKLTLLDSLNKRLVFLDTVCSKIGVEADIIHSRAEDGAKDENLRERFDFSVSRAVAQLNVLSEYCLPYVRKGGKFCALKGRNAKDEIRNAYNAINILGGKLTGTFEFSLPCDGGERTIIEITKQNFTPKKYPRQAAKIKSSPL